MDDWRLQRRARVAGGEVAYEVLGDGPPVVLVHGTPSRSYIWRGVLPVLSERHAVYVFDLLGFGESEKREGMDMSIPAQSRALAELMELWGLEAPAIVGHDIGGAIVLRAHLLGGVRFERIALIDAVVLKPWITPPTRHMQAHLEAYRTMPNHIFEQAVIAHLRTATARPMEEATFDAVFGQWRGEEGQALPAQPRAVRRGLHCRVRAEVRLHSDPRADRMGRRGRVARLRLRLTTPRDDPRLGATADLGCGPLLDVRPPRRGSAGADRLLRRRPLAYQGYCSGTPASPSRTKLT